MTNYEDTLGELFRRDPLGYSGGDLGQRITEDRDARRRWAQEEEERKTKRRKPKRSAPLPAADLFDLGLLGDGDAMTRSEERLERLRCVTEAQRNAEDQGDACQQEEDHAAMLKTGRHQEPQNPQRTEDP